MGIVLDVAFWLLTGLSVWALLHPRSYEPVNLLFVAPIWCIVLAAVHGWLRHYGPLEAIGIGLAACSFWAFVTRWVYTFKEWRALQQGNR